MAKRDGTQDIKPETTVGKAMALLLPPRVREVLRHEPLVRQRDVEGVHDMRVATKRLREAARLFRPAFGKQRMRRHLEHLERLNDGLGATRELDVLLAEVRNLAANDTSLAAGLEPLLQRLSADAAEADEKLTPLLDETLRFLERDFEALLVDRTKKRADVWQMPFVRLGEKAVSRRVREAFALEEAARNPAAAGDFHLMRVAIKKVKYALELFLGVLGKPAKRAYKPIANLQELMGLVHDLDVLLQVLGNARGRIVEAEVADRACALVTAERQERHAQVLALLDSIHAENLDQRLLKALNDRAK